MARIGRAFFPASAEPTQSRKSSFARSVTRLGISSYRRSAANAARVALDEVISRSPLRGDRWFPNRIPIRSESPEYVRRAPGLRPCGLPTIPAAARRGSALQERRLSFPLRLSPSGRRTPRMMGFPLAPHLCGMSTNFSLFRDRFAEACRVRGMTQEAVFRSIGIGGRRVLDLQFAGLRTLDLYRVFQIADRLDVSVDWLVGRSDVMEVPKRQWKAGCLAFAGFSAA